jgi:hypothetical protein
MKYPFTIIVAIVLCLLCCCVKYTVHLKTIPADECEIYLDKQAYGKTTLKGDTIFSSRSMSFFKAPVLELKNDSVYVKTRLVYYDSIIRGINVYNVKYTSGHLNRQFDVGFVFDIDLIPKPLTEKDLDITDESRKFNYKDLAKSNVSYLVFNSNFQNKEIDPYGDHFKAFRTFINEANQHRKHPWALVDTDLGVSVNNDIIKNPNDSLSVQTAEMAVSQNIQYIAVFYGYSLKNTQEFTARNLGKAAAIAAIGLMGGAILIAAEYDNVVNVNACCAIFSVKTRKCIVNVKEKMTSNNFIIQDEVKDMLKMLFHRIDKLFYSW